MGLFDTTDTTVEVIPEEKKYSLDGFFSEMNEEKESFNIPEERREAIAEKPDVKPEETGKAQSAKQKWSSKFITKNVDRAIAFTASVIALDDEIEPYKAPQGDLDDIDEIVYELLKQHGGNIPPGLALLIMIPLIYGPIFKEAIANRRVNKRLVEEAARLRAEKEILLAGSKLKNRQDQEATQQDDKKNIDTVIKMRVQGLGFKEIATNTGFSYNMVRKMILENPGGDPMNSEKGNEND